MNVFKVIPLLFSWAIHEIKASDMSDSLEPPLYPRKVGISNNWCNCYMSALFSCLYNIPFIQNEIYQSIDIPNDPTTKNLMESTAFALGKLFHHMRKETSSVDLSSGMLSAVYKSMSWEVGEYECVLEFWDSFIETLPGNVKQLFKIEVSTKYLRKKDNVEIRSSSDYFNYIMLPLPETRHYSISDIVSNDFIDEKMEDFIINSSNFNDYSHLFEGKLSVFQEEFPNTTKNIPAKNIMKIGNTPTVIIFGLQRYSSIFEQLHNTIVPVNTDHLYADDIDINGEKYVPVSFILFDDSRMHYFAVTKDLLNQKYYLHDDNSVKEMREEVTDIISTKAVMIFYAKLSAWKLKKEVIVNLVKDDWDLPDIFNVSRKRMKRRRRKRSGKICKNKNKSRRRKRKSLLIAYKL